MLPLRGGDDGAVDADQAALRVHQRAAGIAHVDGGVGLDEILVAGDVVEEMPRSLRPMAETMPIVTVWPTASGLPMANTTSPTRSLSLSASVTQGRFVGLDLDDGDVGLRVGADHPGLELAVVGQGDLHLVRALHDVVVGEDVAVGRHDDAGAEAFLARLALLVAEELAEIRGQALAHGFRGIDRHHRLLHGVDHVGIADRHAGLPVVDRRRIHLERGLGRRLPGRGLRGLGGRGCRRLGGTEQHQHRQSSGGQTGQGLEVHEERRDGRRETGGRPAGSAGAAG